MTKVNSRGGALFVWLPLELRRALEPIAAAERRSLRNTVCKALAEWLEDRNAALARATRVRRPIQRSQHLST
jgi:hypothetical protein